jgi:CheY-like chemotaxis protein
MNTMNTRSVNQVLIVDDDPEYIDLVRRALAICHPVCHLTAFSAGPELLAWLAIHQRPHLIFLDIGMPTTSGFDVLETLKTVEKYKLIPVLVLTVSDHKRDVVRSYDIGANGYIEKPVRFADLLTCMRVITRYWFDFGSTPGTDWTNPSLFNLN